MDFSSLFEDGEDAELPPEPPRRGRKPNGTAVSVSSSSSSSRPPTAAAAAPAKRKAPSSSSNGTAVSAPSTSSSSTVVPLSETQVSSVSSSRVTVPNGGQATPLFVQNGDASPSSSPPPPAAPVLIQKQKRPRRQTSAASGNSSNGGGGLNGHARGAGGGVEGESAVDLRSKVLLTMGDLIGPDGDFSVASAMTVCMVGDHAERHMINLDSVDENADASIRRKLEISDPTTFLSWVNSNSNNIASLLYIRMAQTLAEPIAKRRAKRTLRQSAPDSNPIADRIVSSISRENEI